MMTCATGGSSAAHVLFTWISAFEILQPKCCLFRGQYDNNQNIKNMYKTITKELSKCELIDIMIGMDCEEDMCTHTSIQRVLCPIQACDEFGGDPEDSRSLLPGTYLAVYHDEMEDEPFPMFAKKCAHIITDEDKCQMLMNEDGCILIFLLNKYEQQ